MTNSIEVLARARMLKFVRETGPNSGRWVESIQRIGGTVVGQPWCCAYVFWVLSLCYEGSPPFSHTASCDVLREEARKKGMLVETPQPGDLFLRMKVTKGVVSKNDAEHVGFVVDVDASSFSTIEGNTNPDGGREGYGVFERNGQYARDLRGPYLFVRYL